MARTGVLRASLGTTVTGLPLFPIAGMHWCTVTTPLPVHRNPGYEITHLLSGQVTWRVKGGPVLRLQGGDLAITQPQAEHSGELEVIEPCRLFWFVVSPRAGSAATRTPFSRAELGRLDSVLRQAGNCVVRAVPELRHIHLRMAECARHLERPAASSSPGTALHQVRVQLLCGLLCAVESLAPSRPEPGGVPHPLVARALAWMAAHVGGPSRGVPALAAELGISASYLHALFKQHAGQTPADAFNRLRIARAKELLARTDSPITAIAMQLGYSSSQYFANSFRRYTGLTPGGYRRRAGRADQAG